MLLPTSTMSVENPHAGLIITGFQPGSDLRAVEGGQRLCYALARDFLADWSHAILRFRRKRLSH